MSDHTESPLRLSNERKISMPLAFVLGLVVIAATGMAAWTTTRAQVDRNTEDIKVLNVKVQTMQETLFEIRGDVKYLVRRQPAPEKP